MHWRIQQLYGLEGIFPTGKADYKAECPENEKWQKFKKEFWGEKLLATTEWGLIDFDPQGKDDMVGGDTLSYDEYLDLPTQSGKKVRTYFEICSYDADFFSFKGRTLYMILFM